MAVRVAVQVLDGASQLRVPGGRRAARRAVRAAVCAALSDMAVTEADVSVSLLADDRIAALNREYLGHAGPTDVLSFPLYRKGEPVVGEICVGLEQARRQAASLDVPFHEEIARLAVHGTLHVLGLDHPAGAGRLASAMWRRQERIVRRLRAGP